MTHFRFIKPGYARWTPEDDAIMAKLYATRISMPDLIAKVGHPKESIYKRAMQLGLTRPRDMQKGKHMGPSCTLALTLAARPDGVSSIETGLTPGAAARAFSVLKQRGMLFRAALSMKVVRYFTTQAAADRYVAKNMPAHVAKQARNQRPGAAPWDKDAPWNVTEKTKWTYAPAPPAQVFRTNTHSL